MIRKSLLEKIATESGFRMGAIEKVLLLQSILTGLATDSRLKNSWVLKGGTALNLFYLDVPRLSVDIDLNFIGEQEVERLPEARKDFEKILTAVCQRERCTVKRVPTSHAGGKFRLRYVSALGGEQNLEVDVNYLLRIPILGVKLTKSKFPADGDDTQQANIPTLTFEELAAGKCAALVFRTAARDVFDIARIIELAPDLLSDEKFQVASVIYLANGRVDVRELRPENLGVEARDVKERLLPLLKSDQEKSTTVDDIVLDLEKKVTPVIRELLSFSKPQEEFLSVFLDEGEIRPEILTSDVELQERIRTQPPLLWKQKYIREQLKLS